MPPKVTEHTPLILGFDTSAAHCAAALLCADRLIANSFEPMQKGQAEFLIPMLQDLLAQHGLDFRDLTALGVGIGPGNFTGVRISVAAARGLSLGLGVPAIGISALEAAAYGATRPCLVALDARRETAYVQGFDTEPHIPGVMPLDILPSTHPIWGTVTAALPPIFPISEAIARLAGERFTIPQSRPTPFYIRAADAAPSSDLPPKIIDCVP
ncbi:MAG: tRNA threonylcarbamoyladenosine biosynthesis protein TsaB [Paracoccaceae bacterium]